MKSAAPLILLLLLLLQNAFSQNQANPRAKWFTEARFGMFIHWGIYSGAEGIWKGEKLRFHNNYAEWIKYRNRISNEEYISLLNRFVWDEIDPEEWVILAKKSGMKYVTITAKHHDGFGLWDSASSNYDLGNYTDPKQDVVRELAAACRKHGIKLCLYYSHWIDWEHQFGWDHTREVYGLTNEDFDQYWQEKVIPQIRELLTNYGKISMLWFDMWLHHSDTVVSKEQLLQLKSLIRELQSDCLVNSRLGLSIEEDPDVDYKTLGDNRLGNRKEDFPWQSPATVAHSWGFHALDAEWKSTTTLLRSLINNVSLNGNFMLNIGPRANGDVPYEIAQRMLEMGRWLDVNGESIYGAGAFDLRKDQHDWGMITAKETEKGYKLYLHVYNWPLNKQLKLTGIVESPRKVYVLADKHATPLTFAHKGPVSTIQLPAMQPDPFVSVVVVEYDQKPAIEDGLAAVTVDGGYSLRPANQHPANNSLKIEPPAMGESIPEHVAVSSGQTLKWKLYVAQPGEKTVDVSYSCQGEPRGGSLAVNLAGMQLKHTLSPTGKTVGEPNRDWVIDCFESHRIGRVAFPEPGYYELDLSLQPAAGEEVKFQWVWIQ
jgi:alpha-L-fucosidase